MPLDEALVCMGLVAGKESAKSKDIFMHLKFVVDICSTVSTVSKSDNFNVVILSILQRLFEILFLAFSLLTEKK